MASQDWFDKDFYKVLGVDKTASDAELKKTYRKLARQYHPDSNPGDAAAEARFKEISEAYSVLSDKDQRAEYDQVRAVGSGARFTAGGPGAQGGFEDVFGGMFGGGGGQRVRFGQGGGGGFEDILGGMFGGGGGFGQSTGGYRGFGGPSKGADVTASTTLDFATAIAGDTVKLSQGNGRPVNVRIPAGVADGQKIRLRGRGQPSPDGGEAGDLVVTVSVRKHPVFERDGLHLRVHPAMVPVNAPIASVEGVLNAVECESDFAGTTLLEGRGAGAGPTASAVVGDLIDIAVEHKIIEKSGAWFAYGGERLGQGRENVKNFLKENLELRSAIEDKVRRALGMVKETPEAVGV